MAISLQNSSTRIASAIALGTVLALVAMAIPAMAETTVPARVDGAVRSLTLGDAPSEVNLEARLGGTRIQLVDTQTTVDPATVIDFAIQESQDVRIEVLDLDGQLVRTLASGLWARGDHRMAWHHDDDAGRPLDAGLYVVRLIGERGDGTLALAR